MTIITAEWRAMTFLTLSLSCKRDLISAMHHQLPKNDELGPIVSGVYLHSSYNPTKEAENFILNYEGDLKSNKNL